MRAVLFFAVVGAGCVATIPLEDHKRALAEQQAGYEERMRRLDLEARRQIDKNAAALAFCQRNQALGDLPTLTSTPARSR